MPLSPEEIHIETTAQLGEHQDETIYRLTIADLLAHKNDIEQGGDVVLGEILPALSSTGAIAREVIINKKKVGALITFTSSEAYIPKVMFAHAERSKAWFDKKADKNGYTYTPNISKIETYFAEQGKEITMITTGPTFEQLGQSQMTGIAYDNGAFVGSEKELTDLKTTGKGIAYIRDGKLYLSHTSELSPEQIDQLITEKRDIVTMSSLKRNNNINSSSALRDHTNSHTLVQFTDGTIGMLVLTECTADEKKAILSGLPQISRALYGDAGAQGNYLDGMWIQTQNGLTYTHPERGNLFTNTQTQEPSVVSGNMPGIFIFYTEKK